MFKEIIMKYLKIYLCFLLFLGITVLYIYSFGMRITPAGQMGQITAADFFVSLIYIVLWFAISIIAGYKGLKSLYVGGIAYSCLESKSSRRLDKRCEYQ
jgi:hypothetical protein